MAEFDYVLHIRFEMVHQQTQWRCRRKHVGLVWSSKNRSCCVSDLINMPAATPSATVIATLQLIQILHHSRSSSSSRPSHMILAFQWPLNPEDGATSLQAALPDALDLVMSLF